MFALVQMIFARIDVLLQKVTFFLGILLKLSLDCRFAALKCTYQVVKMLFQSLRRLPRQMGSGVQSEAVASSREQSRAVEQSGAVDDVIVRNKEAFQVKATVS